MHISIPSGLPRSAMGYVGGGGAVHIRQMSLSTVPEMTALLVTPISHDRSAGAVPTP
jgi:hypothetical protein